MNGKMCPCILNGDSGFGRAGEKKFLGENLSGTGFFYCLLVKHIQELQIGPIET